MILACQTYLNARLTALVLPGTHTVPYIAVDPVIPANPVRNIFYDELPLDFLKDHDYAVSCLPLQDRSKRNGKLIAKSRILLPSPIYTLTRRRFNREILFRCLLYAKTADELWGSASGSGLVEQFQQALADHKLIADSDNSAIKIAPQDTARPWDSGVELERKLRRPRLAIVRVLFTGGLQTTTALPIIPDVTITPHIGH